MNIFYVSHALAEIEEQAVAAGIHEHQMILFHMWLSEDKFQGHNFDDAFISKALKEMSILAKEFEEWAHKEAMESIKNKSEPW